MLPSVTVVEEVREVILKSPTVEDVHVYPLQKKKCYTNSMAFIDASNIRDIGFDIIINRKKEKWK